MSPVLIQPSDPRALPAYPFADASRYLRLPKATLASWVGKFLRDSGVDIHLHYDHFVHDARDEEILTWAAEAGFSVLSKDGNIARQQVTRSVVVKSKVCLYVLTDAEMTGAETGATLLRQCPGWIDSDCRSQRHS